eukprot:m.57940 g.57940  ORF g.57940 m.57940 type:complete len:193 (-) comp7842_c0_seq3:129-707(-)
MSKTCSDPTKAGQHSSFSLSETHTMSSREMSFSTASATQMTHSIHDDIGNGNEDGAQMPYHRKRMFSSFTKRKNIFSSSSRVSANSSTSKKEPQPIIHFTNVGSTDLRHEPLSSDDSDPDEFEWSTTTQGTTMLSLGSTVRTSHSAITLNGTTTTSSTTEDESSISLSTKVIDHTNTSNQEASTERDNPFSE